MGRLPKDLFLIMNVMLGLTLSMSTKFCQISRFPPQRILSILSYFYSLIVLIDVINSSKIGRSYGLLILKFVVVL